MPTSDGSFRCRLGPRDVHDEVGDQVAQVESVVEPVSECAKVGLGPLAVLQRLEGARHHGLELVEQGVDPLELGKISESTCRTGTGSGGWTSGISFVRRAQVTVSVAHWTSLLRQVSNQVGKWTCLPPRLSSPKTSAFIAHPRLPLLQIGNYHKPRLASRRLSSTDTGKSARNLPLNTFRQDGGLRVYTPNNAENGDSAATHDVGALLKKFAMLITVKLCDIYQYRVHV